VICYWISIYCEIRLHKHSNLRFTLHIVVVTIQSSVLAIRVDLCGLRTNSSLIRSTCSLADGRPEILEMQAFVQKVITPACDRLLDRRILPKCYSEPAPNSSHRFWLRKPQTTLQSLLLRRHFRTRTVTALQWPGSELSRYRLRSVSIHLPSYFIVVTALINLTVKVKLSLCFNWAPCHWGVLGEWRYSSTQYLGTRWRWVVSFTPMRFYPQWKIPWYPMDRRLGGPQSRSGRGGEEKNPQPLPGLKPPIIQPIAQRYTTELSRLISG
jgi:hypothetical protein